MVEGSCLCGQVRFEVGGPLTGAGYCHCEDCRKSSGSAFSAGAMVRASDFRWITGEEHVSSHPRSRNDLSHFFCQRCGSSLITAPLSAFDKEEDQLGLTIGVHLGTLDTDPGLKPRFHMFVRSKAPWFEISDSLPQFPDRPRDT